MPSSRQLAAIMFTDIVGYTSLMGMDEQKAFAVLNKNRALQKPLIEKYNGKWIKELGDGVLSIFPTGTDAVQCANEIREACLNANEFKLRIGIHLGEVLIENDDVFGNGVNIAARIQAIASPQSIYISEAVYRNISNKTGIEARFLKEHSLKNVKEPVKLYEVIDHRNSDKNSSNITNGHTASSTNSIAVLPFVNMSNNADQDYFCDGVSEEILNALTHLDNLRVVSRTSAFATKDKNLDAREIGNLLAVDTLLEGSVRKAGNKLRITTKLVNVSNGVQIWSERYDRESTDIFEIQDDIATNVATALKGILTQKEKAIIQRPETILEAYEYFLKGRQYYHKLLLPEAKDMFEKAIAIDSEYALAYAGLADTCAWMYDWLGGRQADLEAAKYNSQQALLLGPNLSESHTSRAFTHTLAGQNEEAENEFKEAIRLNSNSFDAYYMYARFSFAKGNYEQSVELFKKAAEVRQEDYQSLLLMGQSMDKMGKNGDDVVREGIQRARKQLKLNPADGRALSLGSTSLFKLGEKEEAFEWLKKSEELYPEDASVLINGACLYAKANNTEQALRMLEKAVALGFGKKEWLLHDPDYDSIREEPRFKALLAQL